jgi:general secretion pathway protein G
MFRITSHKNKGFTLIELLVVIAIIGLLSSVILAALNSARKKAESAKIASDMLQVQKAIELYRSDNNGDVPPGDAAWCVEGDSVLSVLIDDGYISSIPDYPGEEFKTFVYCGRSSIILRNLSCGSQVSSDYIFVFLALKDEGGMAVEDEELRLNFPKFFWNGYEQLGGYCVSG